MGCQCYQISGPFIAEDPSCPAHGEDGYADRLDRLSEALHYLLGAITDEPTTRRQLGDVYTKAQEAFDEHGTY